MLIILNTVTANGKVFDADGTGNDNIVGFDGKELEKQQFCTSTLK